MTDTYVPEETDPSLPPVRRPLNTMERLIVGKDAAPEVTPAPAAGPWTKYGQPQGPWNKYGAPTEPKEAAKGILSRIKEAVVGQNEFDFPEVDHALHGGQLATAPINARVKSNIYAKYPDDPASAEREFDQNLSFARGDKGLIDVLKQYDPEMTVGQDKFGNSIVNFGGSDFYINKGGISRRDIHEGLRDTAVMAPFSVAAGAVTKAMPFLGRMLAQSAAGAVGSGASDILSSNAGSQQGFQVTDAIAQALGGAGGEALGTLAASIVQRIKTNPARYVNPDGTLTPAGADIFKSAGFDPADVSDKVAAVFAARVRNTGANAPTARDAAASEFDIKLTRGDATQDFDRIAFEKAAESGARGKWAGELARKERDASVSSIEQAKGNIGEQLGPKVTAQNPQDNAAAVLEGLRTREEAHGKVVSAAYEQAAEQTAGKTVPNKEFKGIGERVDGELKKAGIYLDAGSQVYPAANAARSIIDKVESREITEAATAIVNRKAYSYQRGAGPDMGVPDQVGKTVNVPATSYPKKQAAVVLDSLETIRKSIAGKDGLLASAATPQDRRAVRAVVKGYNEWLDEVTDHALMSEGGDVVAAQIKNARAAASKHFSLFNERQSIAPGATDDAGKVIERMVNAEVSPNEVANFLWGSSKVGEQGRALRVVDRIKEIIGGGPSISDAERNRLTSALATAQDSLRASINARQPTAQLEQEIAQYQARLNSGGGSPEWDALRRGMWQKMTQEAEGKTQPGAQAVSQNILEFVNGKGGAMAKALFTPDELAKMRRFAAVLKSTVPPNDALNRGQSGYEIGRMIRDFMGAAPDVVGKTIMFGKDAYDAGRAVARGVPRARTPSPAILPAGMGPPAVALEQGYMGE